MATDNSASTATLISLHRTVDVRLENPIKLIQRPDRIVPPLYISARLGLGTTGLDRGARHPPSGSGAKGHVGECCQTRLKSDVISGNGSRRGIEARRGEAKKA